MTSGKKVFYKINSYEYLNDDVLVSAKYGNLCYDILSLREKEPYVVTIEDYDELVKKVLEAKKLKNTDVYPNLYVEKHFGKYWVYEYGKAWVEEGSIHAGRIDRKTFAKYTIRVETEIIKPTLDDLINRVSLENALDYIKHLDNGKQVLLECVKRLSSDS